MTIKKDAIDDDDIGDCSNVWYRDRTFIVILTTQTEHILAYHEAGNSFFLIVRTILKIKKDLVKVPCFVQIAAF